MTKAPIYKEHGAAPLAGTVEKLRAALSALEALNPPEGLMREVWNAVDEVQEAAKATLPISKGGCRTGYGISKTSKAIACDNVVTLVRAIKSHKGW